MIEHVVELFMAVVYALWDFIVGLVDVPYYLDIFKTYRGELTPAGWVCVVLVHILLLVLVILVVYLIYRGFRIAFRFKVPVVEYEKMRDEVVRLNREVMKTNYEKDKILAMKVSELGMPVNEDLLEGVNANLDEDGNPTGEEEKPVETIEVKELRFPRLSSVDAFYKTEYVPPEYDKTITLEELCQKFRNFAASKLGLYYDLEIMKEIFASFGAAKMVILQGISGTGKTSLPYAFGQFIENPSVICSVQPSWRDRTELVGYYNEFTKKYTETEFLKTIYEAQYNDDLRVVILDEMNIARVEYYFAEMLSILELPREDERHIALVSSKTSSDPDKMVDGKIWIPSNVWYVGTINNDDSTFAVSDKVYDRAIPIDLDSKAEIFDAPEEEPMRISYSHLSRLYEEAKAKYPISEEVMRQMSKLDDYLIKHFRLTFGNRIIKQMKDYVPCYVACGGVEIDGIDFIFANKILRKFESLGMGFIRDEIDGLITYLDHQFGEENMKISKNYLLRLKKMGNN
ncbi:MAG: hypothetical protein PHE02_06100 [Lachnospiraceae bacterium]|nr:hypothetical protein [Lachnospiraceae bacterium]